MWAQPELIEDAGDGERRMLGRELAVENSKQLAAQRIGEQGAIVFDNGFDRELRRSCGPIETERLTCETERVEGGFGFIRQPEFLA